MILSYVAIFLLLQCGFSESTNFTVLFELDESMAPSVYECILQNQTYTLDDPLLKAYGAHKHGFGNGDIKVIRASNGSNTIEKFPTLLLRLFKNVERVYFEDTKLKLLNASSFNTTCDNLQTITFGNDNLQLVDSHTFEKCSNLQTIVFYNNIIDSIDDDAFFGLSNLKTLTLIGNNFTSVSNELFKPLSSLMKLTISNNPIKELDENLFSSMKNLVVVNLSENELFSIPPGLFRNNENLDSVDLSGNKISKVESNFLVNLPYHVSLNFLSNECVDKDFQDIGGEEWTQQLVSSSLDTCFKNYEESLEVVKLEKQSNDSFLDETTSTQTTTDDSEDEDGSIDEFKKFFQNGYSFDSSEENEKSPDEESSNVKEFGEGEVSDDSDMLFGRRKDIKDEENFTKDDLDSNDVQFGNDNQKSNQSDNNADSSMEIVLKQINGNEEVESATIKPASNVIIYQNETSIESKNSSISSNGSESSSESFESSSFSGKVNFTSSRFDDGDDEEVKDIGASSDEDFVFPFFDDDEIKKANDSYSDLLLNNNTKAGNETEEETFFLNKGEVIIDKKTEDKFDNNEEDSDEKRLKDFFVRDPKDSLKPRNDDEDEDFLHSYEKASCRFYVNAQNEYTGVINGAKKTLVQIDVDHIKGFNNEDVEVLYVRDSILSHIPKAFFKQFPSLKTLSVSNCGLKLADSDLFEVCGRLKHLDLSNNKIEILRENALEECVFIESIDLSNNPLRKIESGIFSILPDLKVVTNNLEIGPN